MSSGQVCVCGHARAIHSSEYGCEARHYAPAFCSCKQFEAANAAKWGNQP